MNTCKSQEELVAAGQQAVGGGGAMLVEVGWLESAWGPTRMCGALPGPRPVSIGSPESFLDRVMLAHRHHKP